MERRRLKRIRECMRRGRPMAVREYRMFAQGYTYAVCPHCGGSMEREYVGYCICCGQRLDWREYAGLFAAGET